MCNDIIGDAGGILLVVINIPQRFILTGRVHAVQQRFRILSERVLRCIVIFRIIGGELVAEIVDIADLLSGKLPAVRSDLIDKLILCFLRILLCFFECKRKEFIIGRRNNPGAVVKDIPIFGRRIQFQLCRSRQNTAQHLRSDCITVFGILVNFAQLCMLASGRHALQNVAERSIIIILRCISRIRIIRGKILAHIINCTQNILRNDPLMLQCSINEFLFGIRFAHDREHFLLSRFGLRRLRILYTGRIAFEFTARIACEGKIIITGRGLKFIAGRGLEFLTGRRLEFLTGRRLEFIAGRGLEFIAGRRLEFIAGRRIAFRLCGGLIFAAGGRHIIIQKIEAVVLIFRSVIAEQIKAVVRLRCLILHPLVLQDMLTCILLETIIQIIG